MWAEVPVRSLYPHLPGTFSTNLLELAPSSDESEGVAGVSSGQSLHPS
jgi:hypothetical protein